LSCPPFPTRRSSVLKWLTYLTRFRFGSPTRFGMLNEVSGILPSDSEVTIAMSAFGQGIGVTQVQMLRAFTAISNNGVMLEPKFIDRKSTRLNSSHVS